MQDLLNHVAARTQLFLSLDNQPHATLPSGAATPIYSEDFFTFLNAIADDKQIDIPNAVKLGFALRKLDAQAHASQRVQPVPLRTFQPDPQTLLVDLHENFDAVELTRKSWKITSNLDTQFLRPSMNLPLPAPEPPQHDLPAYLTRMFQLQPGPALEIANWLALAMLPDAHPPILVITGEARDEAAEKLRKIIDPVPQPLFPLPQTAGQLGQLALTNRVLAFAAYGNITKSKQTALDRLRKGMMVPLKESNKRRGAIFTKVARPIIIATETSVEISRHQINIEINYAGPGDHPQILGALLNLVAQTLHRAHLPAVETIWETPLLASPNPRIQSDTPGP